MDSTLSCMTDGHNIYTINKERKLLFLTHPDLAAHLYNETPAQDASDYYARKAAYLQKHGYTEGMHHQYDAKMTPEMVKDSLANLRQLVFEVTDACDLRCKYCGYGELYSDHDERHAQKMPFDTAKKQLISCWKCGRTPSRNLPLKISLSVFMAESRCSICLLSGKLSTMWNLCI